MRISPARPRAQPCGKILVSAVLSAEAHLRAIGRRSGADCSPGAQLRLPVQGGAHRRLGRRQVQPAQPVHAERVLAGIEVHHRRRVRDTQHPGRYSQLLKSRGQRGSASAWTVTRTVPRPRPLRVHRCWASSVPGMATLLCGTKGVRVMLIATVLCGFLARTQAATCSHYRSGTMRATLTSGKLGGRRRSEP